MSIMTRARGVPRGAVGMWLQAVRAPLTAYEVVSRRGFDPAWAPAVAFDTFEAAVKEVVGVVLRDEQMVEQARLTRAKISHLREAADLEAVAEGKRRAAGEELDARREANASRRAQVRETAEERKARLQAEHEHREREIDQEARAQHQRARAADRAVEEGVEGSERRNRMERVKQETAAVTAGKEALQAEQDVLQLDSAITRSKRARRSRR